MIRKVRFPLKAKLSGLIFALLLGSTAIYLLFAIHLFKDDKTAYIYEDTLKSNEALFSALELDIKRAYDLIKLLDQSTNPLELVTKMPHILEYSSYQLSQNELKRTAHYANITLAEEYGFLPSQLEGINKHAPLPLQNLFYNPDKIYSSFIADELPHLIIGHKSSDTKLTTIRFLANDFIRSLNRDHKYFSYIVTKEGKSFANISSKQLADRDKTIKSIANLTTSGVMEMSITEDGENRSVLTAFSFMPKEELIVISEIPQQFAFRAGENLIYKSIFFGILLMSLSVIVGILFARRLTNNLTRLAFAADYVSKGDFDQQVSINTRDELGALSDTFNSMAKRIKNYMAEMKEKARLENELEVAKLVQEAFIPQSHQCKDNIEIATYYSPASECGGDWWSFLDAGKVFIFFIADATGHGVPAAFLTATANCCANNIRYYADIDHELVTSPNRILSFMNHAIRSMGGNIHMTALVGIIEKETGKLTYANASHPHPYFITRKSASQESMSKQDIQVLLGESGPRLGHSDQQSYPEHTLQLEEDDTLIFYTDGLMENTSDQGEAFNGRKFFNALIKTVPLELPAMRDGVVELLLQQLNHAPLKDDITLALCRFHRPDWKGGIKKQYSFQELISLSHLDIANWNDLVVISDQSDEDNVTKLLERFPIRHLVGKNSCSLEREIALFAPTSTFDFNTLIENPKVKQSVQLSQSQQIKTTLDQLFNLYPLLEMVNGTKEYLKLMANELLSNAFFHQSDETNRNRQNNICLDGPPIELTLLANEEATILRVADPFGTLSYQQVRQSLIRGFKEKMPIEQQGGAGLGLYLCYNFSHQLIINIEEKNKSEIICVIENKRRYKEYKSRITSFHFNQLSKES